MIYKKGSFTVIPNKDSLCGSPAEMQSIYFWICVYADNEGKCFPTRTTIAKQSGVNIKTLDKYLARLVEEGFLSKTIRKITGKKENTSNLYQILVIDEVAPKTVPPSTENGIGGGTENGAETNSTTNSINLTIGDGASQVSSSEIAEGIESFRSINDNYEKWFKNTTQRKAISELIEKYTLRRVIKAVHLAHFCYKDRYFPNFTTPYELVEKWAKVMKFYKGKLTDKRFMEDLDKFIVSMEHQRNDGKDSRKEIISIGGLKLEYGIAD